MSRDDDKVSIGYANDKYRTNLIMICKFALDNKLKVYAPDREGEFRQINKDFLKRIIFTGLRNPRVARSIFIDVKDTAFVPFAPGEPPVFKRELDNTSIDDLEDMFISIAELEEVLNDIKPNTEPEKIHNSIDASTPNQDIIEKIKSLSLPNSINEFLIIFAKMNYLTPDTAISGKSIFQQLKKEKPCIFDNAEEKFYGNRVDKVSSYMNKKLSITDKNKSPLKNQIRGKWYLDKDSL